MPKARVPDAVRGSIDGRSTQGCGPLLALTMLLASTGAGAAEPARADLESYANCDSSAQKNLLDPGAARLCSDAYLRIKLSFLSGIGPDRYHALPPRQRASANKAGYAAFVAWKLTNAGSIGGHSATVDGKMSDSGW